MQGLRRWCCSTARAPSGSPSWSPRTIATTASSPNYATTSRVPARTAPRHTGSREQIESSSVKLLSDYRGHPSLHSFVADGYQVITF